MSIEVDKRYENTFDQTFRKYLEKLLNLQDDFCDQWENQDVSVYLAKVEKGI